MRSLCAKHAEAFRTKRRTWWTDDFHTGNLKFSEYELWFRRLHNRAAREVLQDFAEIIALKWFGVEPFSKAHKKAPDS